MDAERSKGLHRQQVTGTSPWEPMVGYSRAVRVGAHVYVSGTTATDRQGQLVGVGDPHAQALQALRNVQATLAQVGARLIDVGRTRIYVADIDHWQEVGRAHAQFLGDIRPAATLVEVSRLIAPDILVEIEVDAIVAERPIHSDKR